MEVSGNPRLDQAITAAKAAKDQSYAPYSKFYMGAAVITDRDECVTGTLVENVSFGLSMCAERNALFSSVVSAEGKPELLVLASKRAGDSLTWPCGACLQVALELGGPELTVVACDPDGDHESRKLRELAPAMPYKS